MSVATAGVILRPLTVTVLLVGIAWGLLGLVVVVAVTTLLLGVRAVRVRRRGGAGRRAGELRR